MLVGHYAPAFAIKARIRGAPALWALFLAVQAVDLLFFLLVPLGIERMALHADAQGPLALDLQHLPYSHSLVAALAYAAIAVSIGWLAKKPSVGIAIGLAIASHWVLDLIVHTPDLHVGLADEPRVGLGLWSLPIVALVLELGLLAVAAALFARGAQPMVARRTWIVVGVLALIQIVFATAPASPLPVWALAVSSEVLFVLLAGLALYIDRADRRAEG